MQPFVERQNTPIEPREIKLLVLNIDGTIAGESNTINSRVKEAVKSAQNCGV